MSRKGKGILLTAVVLLAEVGSVQAQEGKLSGTIDLTCHSSYIWRGFDYFGPGGHSAIQPGIDIDLYGTGFGVDVSWLRAVRGGFENAETLNLTLYYASSLSEGETYATDYKLGWVYYGYPDEPRSGSARCQAADMQEIFVALSWPKICPAGIVPSYTIRNLPAAGLVFRLHRPKGRQIC